MLCIFYLTVAIEKFSRPKISSLWQFTQLYNTLCSISENILALKISSYSVVITPNNLFLPSYLLGFLVHLAPPLVVKASGEQTPVSLSFSDTHTHILGHHLTQKPGHKQKPSLVEREEEGREKLGGGGGGAERGRCTVDFTSFRILCPHTWEIYGLYGP